jgi:hypothetical protein
MMLLQSMCKLIIVSQDMYQLDDGWEFTTLSRPLEQCGVVSKFILLGLLPLCDNLVTEYRST